MAAAAVVRVPQGVKRSASFAVNHGPTWADACGGFCTLPPPPPLSFPPPLLASPRESNSASCAAMRCRRAASLSAHGMPDCHLHSRKLTCWINMGQASSFHKSKALMWNTVDTKQVRTCCSARGAVAASGAATADAAAGWLPACLLLPAAALAARRRLLLRLRGRRVWRSGCPPWSGGRDAGGRGTAKERLSPARTCRYESLSLKRLLQAVHSAAPGAEQR